jgi:phage baseplate assembly protein V
MMAQLHQLVKDARRRAIMSIVRGVLSAIDDTQQAQEVQIQLLSDETADGIERFQNYGFSSVPFPGAEAVMACVGGLRSHGIVIAVEDRRYRLVGGVAGEVSMYDDQGQLVSLKRDGIYLTTPFKVQVDAQGDVIVNGQGDLTATITGDATIDAASIALAGGGPAVARVGDAVSGGGVIVGGSDKVTCG